MTEMMNIQNMSLLLLTCSVFIHCAGSLTITVSYNTSQLNINSSHKPMLVHFYFDGHFLKKSITMKTEVIKILMV
jgi:hypothetical protein